MTRKHLDMLIAYEEDPGGGWRLVEKGVNGPDRFKNPKVKNPDTIRWHAPNDHEACIVLLGESAFERKGTPVINEIIQIPRSGRSETLNIADVKDGTYEYGVLVRSGEGEYTYVRGEMSPPGVVVGGGG